MKHAYSPSTFGFYIVGVHELPSDAIEISKEERDALYTAQAAQKSIDIDANGRPFVRGVTVEKLKADKNIEINAARLAANRDAFEHAGKLFDCDELSRSDIDGTNGYVAIHGALPEDWLGAWKAVDNTYLPIPDVAAWKALYSSMVITGNANFARAQALKVALADATTAEQVAAIAW